MDNTENIGIIFPEILIPEEKTNLKKWAVVACDQFTSNEDYWVKAGRTVGGVPSTLHIIIPEVYIKGDDLEERISHAKETMVSYIEDGVLVRLPKGVILVERETEYRTRVGLMLAIDLEEYNTDSSKKPLIRATEETVSDRVPVRIKLREGAAIECPHSMLLIDDLRNTVIGPAYEARKNYPVVYDTPLMLGGGNLKGWFIDDEEILEGIADALEKLKAKSKDGMLFAVGDGNHSLACAKAVWERHKEKLTDEQMETSPLRYALVEVVNLYDSGISMEPIHRVVFNVEPSAALRTFVSILNEMGAEARMMYTRGARMVPKEGTQTIFFESKMSKGRIEIMKPLHGLLAVTINKALDRMLKELPKAEIDYIHGDEEFHALTNEHATLGFAMEPIAKDDLFGLVTKYGVLPKKSFSLGMPEEKRYYFECRLLVEAKVQHDEEEAAEEEYEEEFEEQEAVESVQEELIEETEEPEVNTKPEEPKEAAAEEIPEEVTEEKVIPEEESEEEVIPEEESEEEIIYEEEPVKKPWFKKRGKPVYDEPEEDIADEPEDDQVYEEEPEEEPKKKSWFKKRNQPVNEEPEEYEEEEERTVEEEEEESDDYFGSRPKKKRWPFGRKRDNDYEGL